MDHFLPFYPTNNPKNQDFETMKKTTGVIIVSHKFSPPPPPVNDLKNQNFTTMKKRLEISLFYTCVPKIMITGGTVSEIWYATDGRSEKVTYRGGCPT